MSILNFQKTCDSLLFYRLKNAYLAADSVEKKNKVLDRAVDMILNNPLLKRFFVKPASQKAQDISIDSDVCKTLIENIFNGGASEVDNISQNETLENFVLQTVIADQIPAEVVQGFIKSQGAGYLNKEFIGQIDLNTISKYVSVSTFDLLLDYINTLAVTKKYPNATIACRAVLNKATDKLNNCIQLYSIFAEMDNDGKIASSQMLGDILPDFFSDIEYRTYLQKCHDLEDNFSMSKAKNMPVYKQSIDYLIKLRNILQNEYSQQNISPVYAYSYFDFCLDTSLPIDVLKASCRGMKKCLRGSDKTELITMINKLNQFLDGIDKARNSGYTGFSRLAFKLADGSMHECDDADKAEAYDYMRENNIHACNMNLATYLRRKYVGGRGPSIYFGNTEDSSDGIEF